MTKDLEWLIRVTSTADEFDFYSFALN